MRVLMAEGPTMDRAICKRMHDLSAEQEPDTSTMSPLIQDFSPRQCTPIHSDHNGPDHRVTKELRL